MGKRRMNVYVLRLLLACALLILAACSSEGVPSVTDPGTAAPAPVELEGEVVIYVVAPLSGEYAEQGQSQAAGARLAAATINEQGGVNGQRVVVRTLNDQGRPEEALVVAQTIMDESDDTLLGVIVSETSDPELNAVRDVYLSADAPRQLLVVVPASTNPSPTPVDAPQFFRLSASSVAQASEIAAVMREQNMRDAVVIHGDAEDQLSLAAQFQDAADTYGQSIRDSIQVDANTVSFTQIATDILEQNPAGLFITTDPFETQQMLTALYDINYQGAIFAADRALPYGVIDELGCQAEGLYRTSVVPGPSSVMNEMMVQRYASTEGRVPEPFSVAGYAAVEFIVGAFENIDGNDPAQAADYAHTNTITTLLGDLQFDDAGNRVDASMHFQQVQSRLFRDDFARTVGTQPQRSTEANDTASTYLDRDFQSGQEPIVFADLNWNSALFHNAIARFIIESGYGYPTYAVPGSTVPSFQRLIRGEVDVIMERYNFDSTVEDAITNDLIVDLGANFNDSVQGWFVPRYVIEGDAERDIEPYAPDLRSIDDLDAITRLFNMGAQSSTGQLFGGVPGWTAYKINCLKLKAYRLDDNYALTTSASTGDLFAALDSAYTAGDPILVYLWSPTWPIARYDMVQLEEPEYTDDCWSTTRGCAYPTSDVRILVRSELPQRAPDVAAFFERFDMNIDDVSAVLLRIEDEELSPDEAARLWLEKNEAIWSNWVPEDVAEQVNAALTD
jgi:glycine betaine/proline transport system substrate-binding protein